MHRLDARVKLLVVVAYSAVVVSVGRYQLAALAPLSILPLAWLWFGQVPLWFALRRVLILCPFIAMLCVMNALYDPLERLVRVGPWAFAVAGGYLTAANVAAKFALGVLTLTAMMCTTPFSLLLEAMRKFRAPRMLVTQLGLLYRYVFVLIDEAMRVRRGRDFRGAARAPFARRLSATGGIVGSLFLRTLERSERIHVAMCARGFRGDPHGLRRLTFTVGDGLFLAGVAGYLVLCAAYAGLLRG